MSKFPNEEWLTALKEKLNADTKYAEIAKNWEGDLCFVIEPDTNFPHKMTLYLDLWHGTCRQARIVPEGQEQPSAFVLSGEYGNFVRILKGELHPIQAMATMKLKVRGNYGYIMRNVPVVLDFVRCAQEVTQETA
ncbi:MAG: SCP2 sterol-binding domain-containing protein [Anaerolineales bacterium]